LEEQRGKKGALSSPGIRDDKVHLVPALEKEGRNFEGEKKFFITK